MEEQADEGVETQSEQGQTWPVPPKYDFRNIREQCCIPASSIERQGGSSRHPDQCFWRRVIWSPDGTHLLAQSDDHFVDLFALQNSNLAYELVKVFSIRAPTTLLAVEWYPFARQDDAASWCFAISARDVPTRLIDAYQGRVSKIS
jgi:WD40 repeat protein